MKTRSTSRPSAASPPRARHDQRRRYGSGAEREDHVHRNAGGLEDAENRLGDPESSRHVWPTSPSSAGVPLERCAADSAAAAALLRRRAIRTKRSGQKKNSSARCRGQTDAPTVMATRSRRATSVRRSAAGVTDTERPPQRQGRRCSRRPAGRQAARDDRGGNASVVADAQQLGGLSRRRVLHVRERARLRHVGPLHHARHALVDVSVPLQQRRANHPGAPAT